MDRRIVNCPTGVIASDLPTGYVWANWIDTLRTVVNGGSWPRLCKNSIAVRFRGYQNPSEPK